MKLSDIEPGRIKRAPDERATVFEGSIKSQGFIVRRIELNRYIEGIQDPLGKYSLLTIKVETDKGTIEMKYDEGFRDDDALDSAVLLLTKYAGLASLINRALMELREAVG